MRTMRQEALNGSGSGVLPGGARGEHDVDWKQWMRALGHQVRRLREFVALSQEQLARLAGVSQGAVSRLEGGRGLAAPMLVVLKVHLVLVRALRALDPRLLSDELKSLLTLPDWVSPSLREVGFDLPTLTREPGLEEFLHLYRKLSERQRQTLLSVARATATALVSPASAAAEREA